MGKGDSARSWGDELQRNGDDLEEKATTEKL